MFIFTRHVLTDDSHHVRKMCSGRRASVLTYIVPDRKATWRLRTGKAEHALFSLQEEVTLGFGERKKENLGSNIPYLVSKLLLT